MNYSAMTCTHFFLICRPTFLGEISLYFILSENRLLVSLDILFVRKNFYGKLVCKTSE